MQSQPSVLIVRLLIFSGRPDPEWTLNSEETNQLWGRVREAIGRQESNEPPSANLGYRGFLVRDGQRSFSSFEFTVFHGVLTVVDGIRQVHWRDNIGLEDFLLQQAIERGYGEALRVFGAFQKNRPEGPP